MDRKKKKEKKSRGGKMFSNDKAILKYLGDTDTAVMIKRLPEQLLRQLVEDHQSEIPGQYKDKFKDIIIFHNKDDKQKAEEFKSFVVSQVEGVRIFMYGDNITQVDTIDNHFPTICFKFRENTGRKGKRIVKVMSAFIFLTKQFFEKDWNELSKNGPFRGMLYDENSLVVPVLPDKKEELGFRIPMGLNQLRPLNHFLQDDELYKESLKTQVLEKIRMRKKMEEQQFRDQVSWLMENVLEKQRRTFYRCLDESCSPSSSDDDDDESYKKSYKTKHKSPPQGSSPSNHNEKDSGFSSFSSDQARNGHNSSHHYGSDQYAHSSLPSMMMDPGNIPYYGHSNSFDFQSMNFSRDSQMHSLPNQYPLHQPHAGVRNGHHGQGIHRHPNPPYPSQGYLPDVDRYYPQQQRLPEHMDSYQNGGYGSLGSNSMYTEPSLPESVDHGVRNISGNPTQVSIDLENFPRFQQSSNMNSPPHCHRSMQSNGDSFHHQQIPVQVPLSRFPQFPPQNPGHWAPNSNRSPEFHAEDYTTLNSDTSSQSSASMSSYSSTSTTEPRVDGSMSGSSQASLTPRGPDKQKTSKSKHSQKVQSISYIIKNAQHVQIGEHPTIITQSSDTPTANSISDSHTTDDFATDSFSSSLTEDGTTGAFDIQSSNIRPTSSQSNQNRQSSNHVQGNINLPGTVLQGQNRPPPVPLGHIQPTKQNVVIPENRSQVLERDVNNSQQQNIEDRNVNIRNRKQLSDLQRRPQSDEELRYQLTVSELKPNESLSSQSTGNFSIDGDSQDHMSQQRKPRPVARVSPISATRFPRDCRIDNTGSTNRSGSNPHDGQPGSSDEETDMKKVVRDSRDDETEVKEVIDTDSEETELKK